MARIAFLGATSRIAKDLVCSMAPQARHSLSLFSRRPDEIAAWLADNRIPGEHCSLSYEAFASGEFDVIINFVGSGDPARTAAMGGSILDITYEFDSLALAYVRKHPKTRYIFISSGVAYGQTFLQAAGMETHAEFPINTLTASDFYSIAKMHAECRHRARPEASIVDIRLFNYFSRTSDVTARFFVTDIIRAIHRDEVLQVGSSPMHRDFLVPLDFAHLIECTLDATEANLPIDAYSKAPLEKFELLTRMSEKFGLRYNIVPTPPVVQATGAKPEYYSTNRRAAEFGYAPVYSSIDGVMAETEALLQLRLVRQ